MKRIKLLLSSVNLEFGGIEKSLINLINSLDCSKYDITLVLEEDTGSLKKDIKNKINIVTYKPSKYKFFNFFKRLKWIICNYHKYDLSICYATYSLSSNFVARVSSLKKILFVHSNYLNVFNKDVSKFKCFFNERYLDSYNKIVFVSNESLNDFVKYFPNYHSNSIVINNIVDVDNIINLSNEDLILDFNYKNIGVFIGRLEEHSKQISLILQNAKKFLSAKNNVGFIIVGDGPDYQKYVDYVTKNNLKNVLFVGSQNNPYKYLKHADFLILTSKYEGYPVVFSEAIILNKPILTTLNITDDLIYNLSDYGIISSCDDLYFNISKILNFKPKLIDFKEINNKRIDKINQLIEEVINNR